MKAVFLTENLYKKLSFAQKAVSSKSQLPILSCFLLKIKKDVLEIYSTDLEIGIKTEVKGNIFEEGEIAVSAKTLADLISSLPKGEVEISLEENNLKIKTDKTESYIQTQPIDDFPSLFEEKGDRIFSFETKKFKEKITKVLFSSAGDTSRPVLAGVLFENKNNKTNMVATDGYRLSIESIQVTALKDVSMVIPAKILREISSFEDGKEIESFLSSENNQIIFASGADIIIGRLIEGEFPEYEKIIPKDQTTRISFLKADFQKAVRSCMIFAKETTSALKIQIFSKSLRITASSSSVGETSFEIEANLTGEENEIAFNPRFLADFLSNIDCEELIFEMTGPLNPGVFKIKEDSEFIHLIMPIRT